MSKKIKITIGIFWILIISGLLLYFIIPKWKIYRNEEFGFELSYPENFILVNKSHDNYYTFSLKDNEKEITYLDIRIEKDSKNYKEPVGPFPLVDINEKSGTKTYKSKLNNISGYIIEGGYEGGGGKIESFFFLNKGNLFNLDLNPTGQDLNSEYLFDRKRDGYLINKKIYNKIKTSFKLI